MKRDLAQEEWDKFFDLLEKIYNLPNLPWAEKAKQVLQEARNRDAETNLEELCGWFLAALYDSQENE